MFKNNSVAKNVDTGEKLRKNILRFEECNNLRKLSRKRQTEHCRKNAQLDTKQKKTQTMLGMDVALLGTVK